MLWSSVGSIVRRVENRLFSSNRSPAMAKISSLTIGGTGISIHSCLGRSRLLQQRGEIPPRCRKARVILSLADSSVLPKQAVPL
jgi:hypothetical protein